ncbi:hypothetical protein Tco_1206593 [Tanacetum coccineum]|uniref:Uncharacterized protein n=1 Tax=Tanacetum coccineum TaxID=301880 RepID=A0ABQ5CKY4_9ASTR
MFTLESLTIDADDEVTLEAQHEDDADLMFDTSVFYGDEVVAEHVIEPEVVTTVSDPTTTTDELTLAQTLIEITKFKKVEAITTTATSVTTAAETRPKAKGIIFYEIEQTHRPIISSIPPSSKDKVKAIMIEPEKPLKRKDQIAADEECKKAMMETDRLLAERLQAREREELIIEEKSKFFVELLNKRKKHFAELRA